MKQCPECGALMGLDREDMVWVCDNFECMEVLGAFSEEINCE